MTQTESDQDPKPEVVDGMSFVPPAPEVSADFPEAGKITAATGPKLMSVLEKPESLEDPQESKKLWNFSKALDKMYEGSSRDKIMAEIESMMGHTMIRKEVRYETCRGLLRIYMKEYGIARHEDRSSYFSQIRTDLLINLFNVLDSFKEFFKDQMPQQDYEYFLRKGVGELILMVSVPNEKDPPLWHAQQAHERLEKIKEITKNFKIISPSKLAEYEELTKKAIEEIIMQKMGTWLFESQSYEGKKDREMIIRLARQYEIELPTEEATWRKEIEAAVGKLTEIITEIEKNKDSDRLKYELKKDQFKQAEDSIRKGIEKFGDKILPESAQPFEQWIEELKSKRKEIELYNANLIFGKEIDHALKSIDAAIVARDERAVSSELGGLKYKLVNLKNDPAKQRIKETLRGYLERLNADVKTLAQEIIEDPSKALINGEKIQALAKICTMIENEIK